MTRDYFQDIVPPEGGNTPSPEAPLRSIRNVAPSARPRFSRPQPPESMQQQPRNSGARTASARPHWVLWGVIVVALIALGFAASTLFLRTTITVVPRTHTAVFDQQTTYSAYSATDTKAPTESLSYSTDAQSFDVSASVPTNGSEQVSTAASGSITVYNAYSTESSRLIKNTRFETPDGKVFRIKDSITIPGKTGSKPGSITAIVYADQPGDAYNIGPVAHFTLPGLKSTPDMFTGIYASSEAAMTGGFVGSRPSITEAARATAEAQLKDLLAQKIKAAYADMSKGYALVSLAQITYSPLSTEAGADGTATVHQKASVVTPVLSRDVLDTYLASETSASTGGAAVSIADPSTFSFVSSMDPAKTLHLGTDPVDFSLTGKVMFVWKVDTDALAKDLAGKNKATFQAIVTGHPSIDSATAKVYPLWKQAFPSDPNAIRVVVTAPTSAN